MLDRIHELYEGLEKQQIMLCFKGGLNNNLITALLGSTYTQIVTFGMIIVALAVKPHGLFGQAEVKKV